jgi:hypothetical protein
MTPSGIEPATCRLKQNIKKITLTILKKVKQYHYMSGVAQRVPGSFMTTAQDGGKVVSLTQRPLLPAGNTPGTHFC